MDSNSLHYMLRHYRKMHEQVGSKIAALDTLDVKSFPKEYETIITDAALLSERATCQLRRIVYGTTHVKRQDYMALAAVEHNIQIVYQDEVLKIQLPCLLPKRRSKNSSQFLLEPLNTALEQFQNTGQLPKFRDCTVCIVHGFSCEVTENRYFDYDNFLQKQMLDTIASHVLVDDNGMLCDVHNTTETAEDNCTTVYIMPKPRFPQWLAGRETGA